MVYTYDFHKRLPSYPCCSSHSSGPEYLLITELSNVVLVVSLMRARGHHQSNKDMLIPTLLCTWCIPACCMGAQVAASKDSSAGSKRTSYSGLEVVDIENWRRLEEGQSSKDVLRAYWV